MGRLRLEILNRDRRGDNGASLELGLEPAVPPGRNDEVGQDECVSRKQQAEYEFEEEDELFESLSVGGGDGGSEGDAILGTVGSLETVPQGGEGRRDGFSTNSTRFDIAVPAPPMRVIGVAVLSTGPVPGVPFLPVRPDPIVAALSLGVPVVAVLSGNVGPLIGLAESVGEF